MALFGLLHTHDFKIQDVTCTCERGSITLYCACGKVKTTVLHDTTKGDEPIHDWSEWEYGHGIHTRTYRGLIYSEKEVDVRSRVCSRCKLKEIKHAYSERNS